MRNQPPPKPEPPEPPKPEPLSASWLTSFSAKGQVTLLIAAIIGVLFRSMVLQLFGDVQRTRPRPLWVISGHRQDLFDQLVRLGEQRRRHCEAERFGSFEIDHQFVFCRRLNRK